MAVPANTGQVLYDRLGRPVHVGDKVRVEGVPDLTDVHEIDPGTECWSFSSPAGQGSTWVEWCGTAR